MRWLRWGDKAIYLITTLTDDFHQVAWVCSAEKVALRTFRTQRICQR